MSVNLYNCTTLTKFRICYFSDMPLLKIWIDLALFVKPHRIEYSLKQF